jgi:putative endonuclease
VSDWLVYIVCCADGSYYTGATTDLDARLAAHNSGRGARYTASRRPVTVVFTEPAGSRAAALRREYAIKRLRRPGKAALIAQSAAGLR